MKRRERVEFQETKQESIKRVMEHTLLKGKVRVDKRTHTLVTM
jgi:hypothetical protein